MAKSKSENNIQEKDIKTKPKKTKKVEKPVDEKISQPKVADDVKVVEDNVKVDVEIDCRSYSNPSNSCVYIRRKRSI